MKFLITLLRYRLSEVSILNSLPSWAGVHALATQSKPSLNQVDFMPVLPHPVTENATNRKTMTNV